MVTPGQHLGIVQLPRLELFELGNNRAVSRSFVYDTDHDMIAGEVIEVLLKINFEKAPKPLRVLGLSNKSDK